MVHHKVYASLNLHAMTSTLRAVYNLKITHIVFDVMVDKYRLILEDGALLVNYNGQSAEEFIDALEASYPELLI